MQLRDYQQKILRETRVKLSRGVKSLVVQLPTGAGKTVIAGEMVRNAIEKGNKLFFICHRKELITQTVDVFGKFGMHPSVICSGYPKEYSNPLQICSIQTLVNRLHDVPAPKVLIFDEVHHVMANSWKKVFQFYPYAFHIGLTATPQRLDGKGLGELFEDLIQGPSVEELIKEGSLSDYTIYAPPSVDMSGVKMQFGEFAKRESEQRTGSTTVIGDAVEHYLKIIPNGQAIIFCTSILNSHKTVEQFLDAGIATAHIDGETHHRIRRETIEAFRRREIKVISNVGLFGEGFDVPALDAVIMLRATASLGMFLQMAGRSLRPAKGKKMAYIIDHVGNVARHGLPCMEREWSLAGSEKKETESVESVRVCPKCFAVVKSFKKYCTHCKYVFEVQEREVQQIAGDLKALGKDEIKKREKELRLAKKVEQGHCKDLQSLITLGRKRGYEKPEGWAKHVFNSRVNKK